ncbi:MAG: 7-carboxy-7-deazaguanine synthase QueE [Planctomycetota bacterium]|nr:MAG: 7-carboxy-7-deazaguanine synthase QueE [Planctomycetota bacterium]
MGKPSSNNEAGSNASAAPIVEIFSSIQGEGLRAGERHCFVRLAGCNRACAYCDTPLGRSVPENARIEQYATRRDFEESKNPLTAQNVRNACMNLDLPPGFHHAAAVTGGEPLLHPDFLGELLPLLKQNGWTTLLETNGTLPDELASIIDSVDVVSMDMKLESATEEPAGFDLHESFLEIAAQTDVYVKLVVVEKTTEAELAAAGKIVAGVNKAIPLIIQPCTKPDGRSFAVSQDSLENFAAICRKYLGRVEIIPQLHRLHRIP